MIRWEGLDPARVERAIKMLVRRLHPTAQGIDGTGGDGGRDVRWDSPEGLVIFEIKSYSARLTNSQKRKIKASLTNAATHRPIRWVLVVPLDPSPAEESWFDGLRQEFASIALEWRGRDWLDEQFAAHADLRRYVEGSDYDLLERARELGHEQAALANGAADLVSRVNTLVHGRAQELSPNWRVDVTTHDGGTVLHYSARVPDAATLDPVVFKPTFTFPTGDPDAQVAMRQLEQSFHYGAGATVSGQYISRFEIDASEQTRQLFDIGEMTESGMIQLGEAINNEGLPLPLTLKVTTSDGVVAASIDITLTKRTVGGRGIRLIGTDASGVMIVTQEVDHPGESGLRAGRFHFAFEEVSGRYPYAVRPAMDFILAMEPGCRLSAHLGHARMGYADIDDDWMTKARPVARMVVAVDELQKHYGELFPVPDGLTVRELLELEIAVKLLAGQRVQWLDRSITADVDADRLEDFLEQETLRRESTDLVLKTENMFVLCDGRSFDIGPIRAQAKVRLANRPELEAAVGDGAAPSARWQCVDGEHIYIERIDSIDVG
jgi:hypothetical protein